MNWYQCPQDEQFDEEHDEQLELLPALAPLELPELSDAYFPRPKLDIILLVFFDLHFGHTAFTFSFMLMVTTSNCFSHLSHLYSYIGITSFPLCFSFNLKIKKANVNTYEAKVIIKVSPKAAGAY